MTRRQHILRWAVVLAVVAGVPAAFWIGLSRLHIETDITRALPGGDPVLASARRILGRHPALDLVTIDLGLAAGAPAAPQRLARAADWVAAELERSGLFDRVGLERAGRALPALIDELVAHLPQLFDARQLRRQVAPLLEPQAVRAALQRNLDALAELEGVGRAEWMARDPLGLRRLVLARLAALNPAPGARPFGRHLLSGDGRHLLLVADPRRPGSDTEQARRITALLDSVRTGLAGALGPGPKVRLTAVGAYRSALDNETIVRADARRAIWVATLGVALLLLLCFPRPWLGLLALLPALAGAGGALLIYSLVEKSISALALGFGGALITITVDHGIAYLQFLDRDRATRGRRAAREVWAVGLFAALTTAGAFATLYLSGFAMLGQVGLFAALGVGLAFLFVHLIFPPIFPQLRPARRRAWLPLPRLLAAVTTGRGWWAAGLALAAAAGLALVGRPALEVDLRAMNTVSQETLAAERRLQAVWGDIFQRSYLMLEGAELSDLRAKADRLAELIAAARRESVLETGFSPSGLLPGVDRAAANRRAWQEFFDPERSAALERQLAAAGDELGYAPGAFAPFIEQLRRPPVEPPRLPPAAAGLLGLARTEGGWVWLGQVVPGADYRAAAFSRRAAAAGAAVFDPGLFNRRLADQLGQSFLRMLAVVGLAVVLLLLVLLVDPVLVAAALLPLAFALVSSLGLMRLLDKPLDIPGLMLAIVVLGMGVDYAIYFVRGQQRYLDPHSPGLGPVRVAVFLAGGSTLVGLGTLALADHAVPRSAGLTTLLGLGCTLLGTFVLLPPLLERLFAPRPFPARAVPAGSAAHRRLVRARYRHLAPGARLFARFKLRLDPMFARLDALLGPAERVLDVGCGFGVPAAWLLAIRPGLHIDGLEPDPQRVRVAARAIGERGAVRRGAAPELGPAGGDYDAVLLLDVIHHLDDAALARSLVAIRDRLAPGGRLVLRATVPGRGRWAWERAAEAARAAVRRRPVHFRPLAAVEAALRDAGLQPLHAEPTAAGREETWLLAERGAAGPQPEPAS